MKSVLDPIKGLFLGVFILANVNLGWTQETPSLPKLNCKSTQKIDGWLGHSVHDYVTYTAYVENSSSLKQATVEGAFASDTRDLVADINNKKSYKRLRFRTLEDAWHWFNILLPKNFSELKEDFKGTLQIYREESPRADYIEMDCRIE